MSWMKDKLARSYNPELKAEDKAVEAAVKYYQTGIVPDDEIIKQLERYEKLDAEAEEIAREDRIYRKKIVK